MVAIVFAVIAAALTIEETYLILNAHVLHDVIRSTKAGGLLPTPDTMGK